MKPCGQRAAGCAGEGGEEQIERARGAARGQARERLDADADDGARRSWRTRELTGGTYGLGVLLLVAARAVAVLEVDAGLLDRIALELLADAARRARSRSSSRRRPPRPSAGRTPRRPSPRCPSRRGRASRASPASPRDRGARLRTRRERAHARRARSRGARPRSLRPPRARRRARSAARPTASMMQEAASVLSPHAADAAVVSISSSLKSEASSGRARRG